MGRIHSQSSLIALGLSSFVASCATGTTSEGTLPAERGSNIDVSNTSETGGAATTAGLGSGGSRRAQASSGQGDATGTAATGAGGSAGGGGLETAAGAGGAPSSAGGGDGALGGMAASSSSGEGGTTVGGTGGSDAATSQASAGGAVDVGSGGQGGAPSASASSSSTASGSSGTGGGADSSAGGAAGAGGAGGGDPLCSSDSDCDDGIACNGVEACGGALGCVQGPPLDCDDGVACTSDACDVSLDSCIHVPNDATCSDGSFCNGVESCVVGLGCIAGTPPSCDDGVACTVDECDDASASCAHTANDPLCDDGSFCNGLEVCVLGIGCISGTSVVCDDGYSCTADSCDEAAAGCIHLPVDAACQDGNFCNGPELCAPGNGDELTGCAAGAAIECMSDGVECTVEACDEAAKACASTPMSGLCPASETCVPAGGGCVPGAPCGGDAECQDGDACNGVEYCDATLHICKAGTPTNCDDGIACTTDSCDPLSGTCHVEVVHDLCDDGFACNGFESCDASFGCLAGTPPDCGDGVACTLDSCEEPFGTCSHVAQHGVCDDGLYCTGIEQCEPSIGCVNGTPPSCSDGVACTVDYCDAVTDSCAADESDELCPCGQTCDRSQGCGSFCVPATCQGKTYGCGNCLDDDADCRIDAEDAMCLGPCDNSEDSFDLSIPGANSAPCKQDCYFDGDTGAGNDGCYWSHTCDPLEVGPSFDPEGAKCTYDPTSKIPGTSLSCDFAAMNQDPLCIDYCAPLTPNGCDCFGCCLVPGAAQAVWLGSTNDQGDSTCTVDVLDDPTKCRPCTQVASCTNACEPCELCLGKDTLPPECVCQICPAGAPLCGGPCGGVCPFGAFCVSGCCIASP